MEVFKLHNIRKQKSEMTLKAAFFAVALTVIIVVVLGILIGNRFFWNKKNIYTETKADIEFKHAEDLAKKYPNNTEAQVVWGSQLLIHKRNSEALTVFEKAYELDHESQAVRLGLGLAYKENEQYNKAIEVLSSLAKQYPFHFLAQYNLALVYQKTKDYSNAIKCYNKALRINSGAADVYLDLARTYAEMGKVDEAKKNVAKAISFVPDYEEALKFQKQLE